MFSLRFDKFYPAIENFASDDRQGVTARAFFRKCATKRPVKFVKSMAIIRAEDRKEISQDYRIIAGHHCRSVLKEQQRLDLSMLDALDIETVNSTPSAPCVSLVSARNWAENEWPNLVYELMNRILHKKSSRLTKEASIKVMIHLFEENPSAWADRSTDCISTLLKVLEESQELTEDYQNNTLVNNT